MARILVVDDEALIAMMLGDLLSEFGHEVVGPAHSEGQALELLDAASIDAAILDVTLGESNSFTVARELRGRGVPFVFATGHGTHAMPDDFRDHLTVSKPFDFEIMRQVVSDLVTQNSTA